MNKILHFIKNRKKTSAAIIILAIIVVYYGYRSFSGTAGATSYVLATVQKGTIIASVSGTGQVSPSDQVDVKPKSSGDVVSVYVKNGQQVRTGALLVQLDTTDAQKAVRDAQLALDNAKIALNKFELDQSTTQQSNSASLSKSYNDGLNQVSSTFIELADIVVGYYNVLYDSTVKGACSPNVCQYGNLITNEDNRRSFQVLLKRAEDDYVTAKVAYDPALNQYRNLRLLETKPDQVKSMLDTSLSVLLLSAQAVKSEQNMLDALVTDMRSESTTSIPVQITTYQSNLASYSNTLNSRISAVSSIISSIHSQEAAGSSAQIGDPLDLSNQQNSVVQKETALQDAKDALAKMYVRAPFDGIVTNVKAQRGDSVSSGTAVATILTKQQVAEISLNEVDVAKIKTGQKATLTFDAIDSLSITGGVADIDALGTVSQGVVSYNVKIVFDTQDQRVKPGMSISSAIITDTKQDVLLVPNSAIKSGNGGSYVLIPDSSYKNTADSTGGSNTGVALAILPSQKTIETGISNDSMTEITSGLQEGDLIVSRTIITTKTTTTTSTQNSLFPTGSRATGGGAARGVTPGR